MDEKKLQELEDSDDSEEFSAENMLETAQSSGGFTKLRQDSEEFPDFAENMLETCAYIDHKAKCTLSGH